ncbi:MAG: hypothetical protein Q9195_007164 [Heterodermia aff. obscurata]
MYGLRTKVSALIRPQPESQRPRKEKKNKKSLGERFRGLFANRKANWSIEYPNQEDWGFNDFLENHNASDRNHSPRNQNSSHNSRGPQGHNVPSRNHPESSTESLPTHHGAPRETSADNVSWNSVSDLYSQETSPFLDYHRRTAEISHEEGSNRNRWASNVLKQDNPVSDAGNEAQIEYERELRTARVARLRDALLMVNPVTNEDAPIGGMPTRHGTGSRYHQYSRPETFAGPSRANEHQYTEREPSPAGTKPTRRDSTLATSSGLQTVTEENELTLADIPPPTRALGSRDTDNMKRHGRVFRKSELPSLLRIGHKVPAERLGMPDPAHDEEHLHISRTGKSTQVTPIHPDPDPSPTASSHPAPRLPTPLPVQKHPDPQPGNDLIHSINKSILRRREARSTTTSPPLLLSQASTTPTNDPGPKRNSSASLLSLPGHYGDGHLPLRTPSPRSSLLSTSSTSSLRNHLIHTLGQHELKHSPTSSSSSLYCKIITVLAQPTDRNVLRRKAPSADLRRLPAPEIPPSPVPLPSFSHWPSPV